MRLHLSSQTINEIKGNIRNGFFKPVIFVQGYKVFCLKDRYWWRGLAAQLLDDDKILVLSKDGEYSEEEVVQFVEEHLDGLIDEYLVDKGYYPKERPSVYIDLSSYTQVNRRRDICDEPSVTNMKRRWKSTRIERSYSTPYYGPSSLRSVIGMRGIDQNGRFVTYDCPEDYGLRDRN